MPISVTTEQLVLMLSTWMWPFIRIGTMLMITPLFGARYVPKRIRLGLAVVLTIVIVPLVPDPPPVAIFSSEGILITAQQVLVGLALGFVLRLIWAIYEVAGQVISQPMALHFASMVDPTSGIHVPMVSQFYVLTGSLVFLALNGHLIFIQSMAESFTVLPVAIDGIGKEGLWYLVSQMSWVFSTSVLIALPAVTALLILNFSFAVMARTAPALNIFAVGFPISLIFGFAIMMLTLPIVLEQFGTMFDQGLQIMLKLMAGVF